MALDPKVGSAAQYDVNERDLKHKLSFGIVTRADNRVVADNMIANQ